MNDVLFSQSFHCPYCGELIETIVDTSQGELDTIEDCSVCCRPIELHVSINPTTHQFNIAVKTDTE